MPPPRPSPVPRARGRPLPVETDLKIQPRDLDSPQLSTLSASVAGSSLVSPRFPQPGAPPSFATPIVPDGRSAASSDATLSTQLAGPSESAENVVATETPAPTVEAAEKVAAGETPAPAPPKVLQKRKSEVEEEEEEEAPVEMPESPTKKQRARPIPHVAVGVLFRPGMLGSRIFRIPSLLTLPGGIVLALCEARQDWHDAGTIDIVMRRSDDSGSTWGPISTLLTGSMLKMPFAATVGNPTGLYDRETNVVWLLFCSNRGEDAEWEIHAREGKDTRRVWVTSSSDFGLTWKEPREITATTKPKGWTWYATGPGLGVQLKSGRLVVPCNHAEDVTEKKHPYLVHLRRSRMVAHVIYSDDHGETWRLGGVAADHTNETTVAELSNGDLMLNSRDWSGTFQRVVQISRDGGRSWQAKRYDQTLVEPHPQGCQGSLLAITRDRGTPGRGRDRPQTTVFFCNPACHEGRHNLTVRRSDDDGLTWSRSFVLYEFAAAYSSLGLLSDSRLGILFEREDHIAFASIVSATDGPLGVY